MWVSKKELAELNERVDALNVRVSDLECGSTVSVEQSYGSFRYREISQPLKDVLMALLAHLNLELRHSPARTEKEMLVLKEKPTLTFTLPEQAKPKKRKR